MMIFGSWAEYRGKKERFTCAALAARIYRPHISRDPIYVTHEPNLEKFGGISPFDRIEVYELFPDGRVAVEPREVLYGNLRFCD